MIKKLEIQDEKIEKLILDKKKKNCNEKIYKMKKFMNFFLAIYDEIKTLAKINFT